MLNVIKEPDPKLHSRFISVTKGMSGFFAVQYWWNPELGGFWEPWDTGVGRYKRLASAIAEAEMWAEEENLPFYSGKE